MDWSSIEQNWQQFRRTIKQKWVKLSDEDLDKINGRRDRLEETIQARYGFATDYVHKEVDDWLRWQRSRTDTFYRVKERSDFRDAEIEVLSCFARKDSEERGKFRCCQGRCFPHLRDCTELIATQF